MKHILTWALSLVLLTSYGQNYVQWTIKPGVQSNQVDVYLRPNFNFNPGSTPNVYFGQVQFAIGWQTSCPTIGQPQVGFTIDPSFNTNGGGTYSSAVFPQATSISPAGETYNVISLNRIGSGAQTFPASVEVKIGTITMTGSAAACQIKIVDYLDAGSDGQASCYATNSATGDYLVAPTSNGNFYSSPGNSLAGGNATSGFAQVILSVSLPVKLVSFTATENNCVTTLSWKTAEEVNFSHFEIEESRDGVLFTKAGSVSATGGVAENQYNFNGGTIDGARYYRLRMVDNDGKSIYSAIRAVNGRCGETDQFMVYPNPVKASSQNITVRFRLAQAGKVELRLYNAAGQLAKSQTVSGAEGWNTQQVQVENAAAGAYYLRLTAIDGKVMGARQLIIK
ncbi:MAG: T9SS type A sorting domain-containing protein [Chitinophagaceae bacterium]|nr:T9SS type A sorting domain-containing protein [Chitinophagaceae bacterium]